MKCCVQWKPRLRLRRFRLERSSNPRPSSWEKGGYVLKNDRLLHKIYFTFLASRPAMQYKQNWDKNGAAHLYHGILTLIQVSNIENMFKITRSIFITFYAKPVADLYV